MRFIDILVVLIVQQFSAAVGVQYFRIVTLVESGNYVRERNQLKQRVIHNDRKYAKRDFIFDVQFVDASSSYDKIYQRMCTVLNTTNTGAIVGLGGIKATRAAMLMGRFFGVPTFVYSEHANHVTISGGSIIQMRGSKDMLAYVVFQLLRKYSWYYISVIYQEDLVIDGFTDTLQELVRDDKSQIWTIENLVEVSLSDGFDELRRKVDPLRRGNARVIILHCTVAMAPIIFKAAITEKVYGKGFAWFATEDIVTVDRGILPKYPTGLMAMQTDLSQMSTGNLFADILEMMARSASTYLSTYAPYYSSPTNYCMEGVIGQRAMHAEHLYKLLLKTDFDGLTGRIILDQYGNRRNLNVSLLNLISVNKKYEWITKGSIIEGNYSEHYRNAIVWPGNTFYGPVQAEVIQWTVVTTPIKPFVIDEAPIKGECMAYVPCIQVHTSDGRTIRQIFQDFKNGVKHPERWYDLKCCKGFSIDLLEKLASEIEFKYQLYLVGDKKAGGLRNGSWNGMVRDLVNGSADMAIAALSITQVRSLAIDFSAPYFYSGISMMSIDRERAIPLLAFLEPLDLSVWGGIVIVGTIVAISMALYEWHSPFGLNPWGRKRKSNYTLASAFVAVYAILFGHTVKTKTPKSWPCKVIQNLWAGVSIFIVASYTANLAAFIAGKTDKVHYESILDPKLMRNNIKVGVKESTAGENYVKIINEPLYERTIRNHLVPDNPIGFQYLKIKDKKDPRQLDIYLGDTPVLEYQKSEHDFDCTMKIVGRTFGDDGYGIGFPKGSRLKKRISQKIVEYHETGFIERLRKNYFYLPLVCFKLNSMSPSDLKLRFENHAGLYVLLVSAVLFCFWFLLPLEHMIFKWLVPYIRKKPSTSRWKNLNMMFVSQRLYRIVTSKELLSANHAFKEMATIIREKKFSSIFQKNEKKQMEVTLRANQQRKKFRQIITQLKQQILLEEEMEQSGLNPQSDANGGNGEHAASNMLSNNIIVGTDGPLLLSRNNTIGKLVSHIPQGIVRLKTLAEEDEPPDEVLAVRTYESSHNGGLAYQTLLNPGNFLPWNAYGSERNLRKLVDLPYTLVPTDDYLTAEAAPLMRSRSVTLRAPFSKAENINASTREFAGLDLATLQLDKISYQNLGKTDLFLLCLELTRRLKVADGENVKLHKRLKHSANKRTRSHDDYSITDEIFL